MAFPAHIFRLIRVAAAFAVILVLGFSLPSAAHSIAGHHGDAAVSHTGDSHAGAAHDAAGTGAQDGQDAPRNADGANCCAGACMAVAVLSLQPEEISVTQSVRWKQENSQLPSREQLALLRPPRA
ncbi:hypothetical protein [Leisingera sp. McT4-56]|uniref:hypothetical protein n=1 Tax=Leisingera sp. McT4-56 TaxID=2881255 RepID=UPI001CF83178|nr:hypothetical protein [Leisingera sp. McT4-56]MCB4458312.1 hypothetical protein [Leisingera sp. McT4-56]